MLFLSPNRTTTISFYVVEIQSGEHLGLVEQQQRQIIHVRHHLCLFCDGFFRLKHIKPFPSNLTKQGDLDGTNNN